MEAKRKVTNRSDAEIRELTTQIRAEIAGGTPTLEACQLHGVKHSTYAGWVARKSRKPIGRAKPVESTTYLVEERLTSEQIITMLLHQLGESHKVIHRLIEEKSRWQ